MAYSVKYFEKILKRLKGEISLKEEVLRQGDHENLRSVS
jgi:hypothetical protein